VPTVLDNPNGHIRGFARAYQDEWTKWIGGRYHGHPTAEMVERVEREYELADRIRVSSNWAKESMVRHGVPAEKVFVCPQPVNRVRFAPPLNRLPPAGPLRIVYVGSLDLRKGFVYLLRAGRAIGSTRVRIELVGGTGDRGSKALLARERAGLEVILSPGDPVPAYHRAELFVLPSLEDGFGFVTAEAMACGVPVVVTEQCGSAEWVRPGENGWVIPAGDEAALACLLEDVLASRSNLAGMGSAARRAIEFRDPGDPLRALAEWVHGRFPPPRADR
jgi:glycosyltransferase involved in cell wall biosynthesis